MHITTVLDNCRNSAFDNVIDSLVQIKTHYEDKGISTDKINVRI